MPNPLDDQTFGNPLIEMHTVLHMAAVRACPFCEDHIPARFPLLAGIHGFGMILATAHIEFAVRNGIATKADVRRWLAAWRMAEAPGWPQVPPP